MKLINRYKSVKDLNFGLKQSFFLAEIGNLSYFQVTIALRRLLCELSVHFHSLYLVLFNFVTSQVFGNNLYYVKKFVEYIQNFAHERTFINQFILLEKLIWVQIRVESGRVGPRRRQYFKLLVDPGDFHSNPSGFLSFNTSVCIRLRQYNISIIRY